MSTELQAVNDSSVEWKTFASKNGASFQVGLKKTGAEIENTSEGKQTNTPESSAPFDFPVDWPVGDTTWKDTSKEIATVAGITRYRLYRLSPVWDYEFDFTTTGAHSYTFFDASGETLAVNVWVKGDHSVRFNSSDPAITRIKGNRDRTWMIPRGG